MNNKLLLEAMALDLKRVALGAHGKSQKMVDRFLIEVFKRNELLDKNSIPKSFQKVLLTMKKRLNDNDLNNIADHALMYSTLLISLSKKIA